MMINDVHILIEIEPVVPCRLVLVQRFWENKQSG